MSEQKKEVIKTKVGGQALIEGVMMLGPKKGCMAVRQPDREIYTEVWDRKTPKWYNKAPFIRGCINFVSQLGDGYKYLNKSGEVSGMFDEEEDEKDKKKKEKEQFTGMPGQYVPLKETLRGFKMILSGECDELPESAFLFAGTIDDVFAKAKKG